MLLPYLSSRGENVAIPNWRLTTAMTLPLTAVYCGRERKFLVNLGEVSYIDSSGLGELITSHTSLRNRGGSVKLLNPNKRIRDLLKMTKLLNIFEIFEDETTAVRSFSA